MNVWERTAELLEAGPDHPDADIDGQILKLARAKPWADLAARLASFHRELSHGRSPEPEDATWAAQQLPSLRPQGWEQAPTGEALEAAILAAYRAASGR